MVRPYVAESKRRFLVTGSKLQVWYGTAIHTGRLRKANLMQHPKTHKIISKKKHEAAKRRNNLGEYLVRKKPHRNADNPNY